MKNSITERRAARLLSSLAILITVPLATTASATPMRFDVPPISGLEVPTPSDLVGPIQWSLIDQGDLIDSWSGVASIAQDEPRILYATGLPSGPVYLYRDVAPSNDFLLVNGGAPMRMEWNDVMRSYDLTIGTLTLRVEYDPIVAQAPIHDGNGDLIAYLAMRPICQDNNPIGIQMSCQDQGCPTEGSQLVPVRQRLGHLRGNGREWRSDLRQVSLRHPWLRKQRRSHYAKRGLGLPRLTRLDAGIRGQR